MADADTPLAARLNYAQCWEDWRMVVAALQPAPGRRLLSVASGGDNAIALALEGAEVVALDLSAPQLAVTELKLAGHYLDYEDFRALLGLDASADRLALYRAIRPHLTQETRAFWDDQRELIERGILHHGRFEHYLGTFRRRVLPFIHRPSTTRGWFDLDDLDAQRDYYARRWDGLRWRGLIHLFFSRTLMAALGRSPEQFAHVQGPIGDALIGRARRVLTELPLADNGYLQFLLLGTFLSDEALPPYLTEDGHRRLGEVAERVTLVHASLDAFLEGLDAGTLHGYNLSDIFEYLTADHTARLLGACAAHGAPGARLAYWNLFVPRHRPDALADQLVPLDELAARLYATDRAFFYGAFHVEEVQ